MRTLCLFEFHSVSDVPLENRRTLNIKARQQSSSFCWICSGSSWKHWHCAFQPWHCFWLGSVEIFPHFCHCTTLDSTRTRCTVSKAVMGEMKICLGPFSDPYNPYKHFPWLISLYCNCLCLGYFFVLLYSSCHSPVRTLSSSRRWWRVSVPTETPKPRRALHVEGNLSPELRLTSHSPLLHSPCQQVGPYRSPTEVSHWAHTWPCHYLVPSFVSTLLSPFCVSWLSLSMLFEQR